MFLFDFHHHDSTKQNGIYNLKYGEAAPDFYFSAGIHPDAVDKNLAHQLKWLLDVAILKNCVAIGEGGLDGRFPLTENLQQTVFREQVALANQLQKPLIIHCVKRFSQLIPLIREATVPVIIHGFNKRKSIGDELLKNGCYLSFGKSLLYDVNLQHFFTTLAPERFFLETDSAQASLNELYLTAAALRQMPLEDFKEQINNNLRSINIPI